MSFLDFIFKIMERLYLLTIIVFLVFSSCENNQPNVERTSVQPEIFHFSKDDIYGQNYTYNLSDLYSEISGFSLELSGGPIGHISKVAIFKNILLVFDSHYANKIFAYDLELKGKFIFSIGEKGKGPGEFVELTDFAVDSLNEQIITIDWTQRRISYFDFNGNFINSKTMDFVPIRIFCDEKYLYFLNDALENDKCLKILDRELNLVAEYLPFSDYPSFINYDSGFLNIGNKILLNYPNCDTVFQLSEAKLVPYLAIESGVYSFYTCVRNNHLFRKRDLSIAFRGYSHRKDKIFQDVLFPSIYFEDNKLKFFEFSFNQKWYKFLKSELFDGSLIVGSISNDFFRSYISLVGYDSEYGTIGIVSTESMLQADLELANEQHKFISIELLNAISDVNSDSNPFVVFLK